MHPDLFPTDEILATFDREAQDRADGMNTTGRAANIVHSTPYPMPYAQWEPAQKPITKLAIKEMPSKEFDAALESVIQAIKQNDELVQSGQKLLPQIAAARVTK